MKKIAVIIFLLCMLAGCASAQAKKEHDEVDDVPFYSGIYYDKNWDDQIGSYYDDVVQDKETALALALTVFEPIKNIYQLDDFVPQQVFYDEEDSIWIVSFWEEVPEITNGDAIVLTGESCSIAFLAENGEVLRIWFGE